MFNVNDMHDACSAYVKAKLMACYTWLLIPTEQPTGHQNNDNKTFKRADILCPMLMFMFM